MPYTDYIYTHNSSSLRRTKSSDLSYSAVTITGSGGGGGIVCTYADYIYIVDNGWDGSSNNTFKIRKFNASDLSDTGVESILYTGSSVPGVYCQTIYAEADYVYIGLNTKWYPATNDAGYVLKLTASGLTETVRTSYTGDLTAISDIICDSGSYLYVAGCGGGYVYKYNKSDLTYVSKSAKIETGSCVSESQNYNDTYILADGYSTTENIKKIRKSDMSVISTSGGFTTYTVGGITNDGDNIYVLIVNYPTLDNAKIYKYDSGFNYVSSGGTWTGTSGQRAFSLVHQNSYLYFVKGSKIFKVDSGTLSLTSSATTANAELYATQIPVPKITTTSLSSLTKTTAIGGGNVTSDEGYTITERGICYNTTGSPTTGDTVIDTTGTTGSFTINMTGLTPSTYYYVRAYAINENGVGYGGTVTGITSIDTVVLYGGTSSTSAILTWTDPNTVKEHYKIYRTSGGGFPLSKVRTYFGLNEAGGPGNFTDDTGNYMDLSGTYGGSGISDANGKLYGCWYNTGTSAMAYGGINLGSWSRTPIVSYYYNSLSVNAWIKRNGSGYTEVIMSTQDYQRSTNTYNGWMLYIDANNHLVFQIRNDADVAHPSWMTSTSTAKLAPNIWYMVTGTYDGMNNTYGNWLKTYINGVVDSNYNQTTPFVTRDWDANTRYVLIGSSMSTSAKQFRGYIDEVSVYAPIGYVYYPDPAHQSQQLTATEIDALYNEGFPIGYQACASGDSLIATVDAPALTYTDTGLTDNCLYCYYATAFQDSFTPDRESEDSNIVCLMLGGIVAPSGITVSNVLCTTADVTWVNNNTSGQTGNYVQLSTDNISFTTIATLASGDTTYSMTGLTPGTTYYVRVLAYNNYYYVASNSVEFDTLATTIVLNSIKIKNGVCGGFGGATGRIVWNLSDTYTGSTSWDISIYNQNDELVDFGTYTGLTEIIYIGPSDSYYIYISGNNGCSYQSPLAEILSETLYTVTGIQRLFITPWSASTSYNYYSSNDEDWYVTGLDTLQFTSTKIKEYIDIADFWYEIKLNTASMAYSEALQKDQNGLTYNEQIAISIPRQDNAKWKQLVNILTQRYIVVFQDNHDQWWTCFYRWGAEVKSYVLNGNTYVITLIHPSINKMLTAIDYNYVKNNIL